MIFFLKFFCLFIFLCVCEWLCPDEMVLFLSLTTLVWSHNDLIWCGLLWKSLFYLRNTVVQLQVPHNHQLRAVRVPLFFFLFLYLLLITSFSGEKCSYVKTPMEMPIYVLHLDNVFHEVCTWPFSTWGWEQGPHHSSPRSIIIRRCMYILAACSGHLGGTLGEEQHRTFWTCIQVVSSYVYLLIHTLLFKSGTRFELCYFG